VDMIPPSPNEASDAALEVNHDITMAFYCNCEQKNFALRYDVVNN
jgi:hypothetical protein